MSAVFASASAFVSAFAFVAAFAFAFAFVLVLSVTFAFAFIVFASSVADSVSYEKKKTQEDLHFCQRRRFIKCLVRLRQHMIYERNERSN
jgi:membrane protein implicated in regulation of membrane protease activity